MSDTNPVDVGGAEVAAAPVVAELAVPATEGSDRYVKLMKPFAATCKKPIESITDALKSAGWIIAPNDEAIDTLADEENAPIVDLVSALKTAGVAQGPARTAINALRKAVVAANVTPTVASSGVTVVPEMPVAPSLLDSLPADDVLLECIKLGGVLTVPRAKVVMAGRCLMANAIGMLNGIDREIVAKIDAHYTESQEEVPEWFWDLSNQITRKQYASVFNAMGMPGASRFASRKKREIFWEQMREKFLPKLADVQTQLNAWFQAWIAKAQAMSGLQFNAAINRLNAGMGPAMAIPASGIPPTNAIIAAVDALVDVTSTLFAGTRRAVAVAIETDARAMRELLARTDLHVHMGYATRPLMLKGLEVAATSDIVLMEKSFATFLMNVLKIPDLPPTQSTAFFLQELCELGAQIEFASIAKGLRTKEPEGNDEPIDNEDDDDKGRVRGIGGSRKAIR